MSRFTISILLVFGLLQLNYSQNKIQQIKPEKILYKSIDSTDLFLHVYRPKSFDKSKVYNCIIFFHGGAWNTGNYKHFQRQSQYFASRGLIAMTVDYRIRSKHNITPFESMEDAKSAIRFVRQNSKILSVNPNMIAAGGGSAGGHLAASSANIDKFDNKNENLKISSRPNALVLFNPIVDTSPGSFGYNSFMNKTKIDLPFPPIEGSPLHNISKDSPPTIIFVGTEDNLIPIKTMEDYNHKMKKVGSICKVVFYDGAEHSFFNKGEDFVDTLFRADKFLSSLGYIDGEPTIR